MSVNRTTVSGVDIDLIAARVIHWCKHLQMDPWVIRTSISDRPHGTPRGTTKASIDVSEHYLVADIEFAQTWVDENPGRHEIDVTVVHELLHCLFRDLDRAVESPWHTLSEPAHEMVRDRFDHEEEQLIDRLAYLIVANHYN